MWVVRLNVPRPLERPVNAQCPDWQLGALQSANNSELQLKKKIPNIIFLLTKTLVLRLVFADVTNKSYVCELVIHNCFVTNLNHNSTIQVNQNHEPTKFIELTIEQHGLG